MALMIISRAIISRAIISFTKSARFVQVGAA